jgi:hypothetical protein
MESFDVIIPDVIAIPIDQLCYSAAIQPVFLAESFDCIKATKADCS